MEPIWAHASPWLGRWPAWKERAMAGRYESGLGLHRHLIVDRRARAGDAGALGAGPHLLGSLATLLQRLLRVDERDAQHLALLSIHQVQHPAEARRRLDGRDHL